MKTLKQIFGICEHEWFTLQKIRVVNEDNQQIATEYHLKCNKCGKIKGVII